MRKILKIMKGLSVCVFVGALVCSVLADDRLERQREFQRRQAAQARIYGWGPNVYGGYNNYGSYNGNWNYGHYDRPNIYGGYNGYSSNRDWHNGQAYGYGNTRNIYGR